MKQNSGPDLNFNLRHELSQKAKIEDYEKEHHLGKAEHDFEETAQEESVGAIKDFIKRVYNKTIESD